MTFDWTISIGNIISAFVIALGWVVAYKLNSKKDLKNKKREIRTQFLIDAYRIIAFSANRDNNIEEMKRFEEAIEQVQFLGNLEQIRFLNEGIETRNFTPLLVELRRDIRNELGIEIADANIKHFRFNK
ncbi:hypothetical protein DWB61_17540 [Ancylomarina euxinus]|uniref:Uncharacterized protein n=1 Tax=Ancylomarina euxinus TaxID=2283627 RepID=A0A425XWD3_9BACT|nr:hypothetical protein [Ancylomarina euxinus]MCZ4696462.1 hypothetical protein [Ancylomarina euxinus]MUP16828.1 hypothetical protein [Ancylomarina euxinus]RRG18957.1 hypothetical protein DWB61_17540 [Ancylomarina euxinus]